MGAGAVSGQSSTPRANQVFPQKSSPLDATSTPFSQESHHISLSGSTSQHQTSLFNGRTSNTRNTMPNKVLACETCENNFTFFKRKKICKDCHRTFCSTCLPKPPSNQRQNGRQCDKCTILTSGKFTRQQLLAWRVKDMRCFLDARNISTSACKEKHDLIELVLLHFCLDSNSVVQEQREHDRMVGELASRMQSSSFYSSTTPCHQGTQNGEPSSFSFLDTEVMWSSDPASSQSQTSPTIQSSHSQDGKQLPVIESFDADSGTSAREGDQQSTEVVFTEMDNSQIFMTENSPSAVSTTLVDLTATITSETENSQVFLTDQLRERQLREMREVMQRLQQELEQEEPETRPGIQRASIDDLQSAEDIDNLTVRQLKEILVNNFVDYRGCCEKHELVDRVRRLWLEEQANRQRVSEMMAETATQEGKETTSSTEPINYNPETEVCKICMDAVIDCLLLECGHMVTCTKCGKRLAECPICRQYIVRVVHVFRS